jgi:hypothetical protein
VDDVAMTGWAADVARDVARLLPLQAREGA